MDQIKKKRDQDNLKKKIFFSKENKLYNSIHNLLNTNKQNGVKNDIRKLALVDLSQHDKYTTRVIKVEL